MHGSEVLKMIELGKVEVNSGIHLKDIRKKLLKITNDLGFDSIHSTRLTTVFSELCQTGLIDNIFLDINFMISENNNRKYFVIELIYNKIISIKVNAQLFFDEYSITNSNNSTTICASKYLSDIDLSNSILNSIRETISLPSREVLLYNLQQKNDELDLSKQRLDLALEASSTGLWDVKIGKKEVYRNNEWYRQLGYDPEVNSIKFDDLIHPDDKKNVNIARSRHLSGEEPRYKTEYRMKAKNGSWKWIQSVGRIINRDNIDSQRIVGVHLDITDQKNMEIQLHEAKEEAEAATKAKGDFLANMSHEIRTPMNAIIGLNHLLMKTELTHKQLDYTNKVYNSSHNLLGIINDILDFSKIEAGKMDIEKISFELTDVFDNLSNLIGMKAQQKGLEFVFDIDKSIPSSIIGDPLRLGQILLNFTNNAIKFTQKGEIVVSAKLLDKKNSEAFIRFDVKDTGIGLTEEQVGKLFKAFSQADTSTTRKYGGTGLGLTISKKLSELMDGEVGVESEYGKGSSFYFTAKMKMQDVSKPKIKATPESIKNLKVLIVDDNETVVEVFKSYLDDFEFESNVVHSGNEAIDEIRKNYERKNRPFDLILMDYQMPGLTGVETRNMISDIYKTKKPPKFILITGFGMEDIIRNAEKSGFDGFLLKPVSQSAMFNKILNVFGHETEKTSGFVSEKKPDGFDKIKGARILLVEDNEINQQVAQEILEQEGFYVEIEDNGEKACAAIQKQGFRSDLNLIKGYDIVLMDLQMPIMDGYEATNKIRKTDEFRDLPIVAMTADAMTGVRERVLKSGMNDYITKPIEPTTLWNTLVKWVIPGKRNIPEVACIVEDEKDNTDIPHIEGIDTVSGLARVGGNNSLYRKLLFKFAKEFSLYGEEIKSFLENGDIKTAERMAHTVKGTSGNLGAIELQKTATKLDEILKNEDDYKDILNQFNTVLENLVGNISSSGIIYETTDFSSETSSKPTLSKDELIKFLNELEPTIKKRLPKKCEPILTKMKAYTISKEYVVKINEIGALIEKYKFKDASILLEQILNSI